MKNFKIDYHDSVPWLIFWLIVLFPIAIVLLFTASTFHINQKSYTFSYAGSRFWLAFWTVVCFPIACVLLFLNGLNIRVDTHSL